MPAQRRASDPERLVEVTHPSAFQPPRLTTGPEAPAAIPDDAS